MRTKRMHRVTAAVSVALLAGLMVACGPDAEENSSPEQSGRPTLSSSATPSGKASTGVNPKPTTDKEASATATPSEKQGSGDNEAPVESTDPAKNDPEIDELDINLNNNSNCSPGETMRLTKIVGWEDGSFTAYIWFRPPGDESWVEYTTTAYVGGTGNPMEDWSFVCNGKAPGQYRLKFVSDNVDVSPTQPVTITVY